MKKIDHNLYQIIHYLLIILSLITIISPERIDIDIINNNNDIVNYNKIVTTVTCYYNIDNNHYTDNEYISWIANFMKIVSHVVIYVDEISYQILSKEYPGTENRIYIKRNINNDFVTSNWDWKDEYLLDRRHKYHHNEKLYKIYNEKVFMVRDTITLNPFKSNKYIWLDIGSFRTPSLFRWLHEFPCWDNIDNDKVILFQLFDFQDEELQKPHQIDERFHFTYRIAGSSFGGPAELLLQFADIHYNTLSDAYVNYVFRGDDQYLFAFDYIRNPSIFKLIKPPYEWGYSCYPIPPGNPWFYSHIHLSNWIVDWAEFLPTIFPLNCSNGTYFESYEEFYGMKEEIKKWQRDREIWLYRYHSSFPIQFDDTSFHSSASLDFFLQYVHYDIREGSRLDFFKSITRKKDTLHIGCADWPIRTALDGGVSSHLHADMCLWYKSQNDSHLYKFDGYDTRDESINKMKENPIFSEPSTCDLYSPLSPIPDNRKYDVLLIPETIEHVDNVKEFLQTLAPLLKSIQSMILITTPNAFSATNINNNKYIDGKFRELIHPDHNCYYSAYTLPNTIRKAFSSTHIVKFFNIGSLEDDNTVFALFSIYPIRNNNNNNNSNNNNNK